MAGGFLGWLQAKIGLDNSDYKTKIKETEKQTTESTTKMLVDWNRLKEGVTSFSKAPLKVSIPKVDFTKFNQEFAKVPEMSAKATRSFNGLNFQAQLLARELPVLALSPQMFFLAISNNLPMLGDEIAKVNAHNKALNAEGKKGIPVWKQLLKAFTGWQSMLVIGVTLLTAYGGEFVKLVGSLFSSEKQALSTADAMRNVNDAIAEGGSGYGENIYNLKRLSQEWLNVRDTAQQTKWLKDNQTEFEKLGVAIGSASKADDVFIKNTDSVIEGLKLRAKAAAAAKLAQEQYEQSYISEQELEAAKEAGVSAGDKFKAGLAASAASGTYGAPITAQSDSAEDVFGYRIAAMERNVKRYQEAGDKYFEIEAGILSKLESSGIIDPEVTTKGAAEAQMDGFAAQLKANTQSLLALEAQRGEFGDTNAFISEQIKLLEERKSLISDPAILKSLQEQIDALQPPKIDYQVDYGDMTIAPLVGSIDYFDQEIAKAQIGVNSLTGAARVLAQEMLNNLQIQKALASGDFTGGLNLQSASVEQLQGLWDIASTSASEYLEILEKLLEFDFNGQVTGLKGVGNSINDQINKQLDKGLDLSSAINTFSSSLGEALSDGALSGDELKNMFVTPLAETATQMGGLLIAYGVALEALKSLPAPAKIAAGVALVALGSALSASISNTNSSLSGGGGGSVDTFTGGYSSGTSSETWASSTKAVEVNVKGSISGRDILLATDRQKSYTSR